MNCVAMVLKGNIPPAAAATVCVSHTCQIRGNLLTRRTFFTSAYETYVKGEKKMITLTVL